MNALQRITLAALLAVSAFAAHADEGDPSNGRASLCASLSKAASIIATTRDAGQPASVAKNLARESLTGPSLRVGLAMVDVVYENDWTPAEASRQIRRTCLARL